MGEDLQKQIFKDIGIEKDISQIEMFFLLYRKVRGLSYKVKMAPSYLRAPKSDDKYLEDVKALFTNLITKNIFI